MHTPEDADEGPFERVEKRDHMLEKLLVVLNSAAAIGVGPDPRKLAARTRSPSQMPGSGQGVRKG